MWTLTTHIATPVSSATRAAYRMSVAELLHDSSCSASAAVLLSAIAHASDKGSTVAHTMHVHRFAVYGRSGCQTGFPGTPRLIG